MKDCYLLDQFGIMVTHRSRIEYKDFLYLKKNGEKKEREKKNREFNFSLVKAMKIEYLYKMCINSMEFLFLFLFLFCFTTFKYPQVERVNQEILAVSGCF